MDVRKEVTAMPNPHFDITITQRSKGQSSVAGAAYQHDIIVAQVPGGSD